ncbi:ubiquitin family [Trichoderma arundinaceum]|uniref:Ubiquitin family n=1 Tax=Trichoderma arundinaceum TaxID=490622 RepID=A0A395NLV3_TRIAR|nr:ubiquitin family [Trichoderma arundinaceum]
MASELFNQAIQGADPASSDQPVINLQVVSPSVGVNRPLLFPGLPAATTIKQLKERIRQTLPLRPSDENQRLIYRGRALLRDSDSLLDVFGADAEGANSAIASQLRTPDQQTIHLVIRDASDSVSSTPSFLSGTQSPALGNQPPNLQRQTPPHAAFMGPPPPPGMTRRSVLQPTQNATLSQPRMPSPARPHSPAHTPEQAAAFQQQHQSMTQWLTQIQREAMARMVNQNQRGRAHMGMRGVGDTAPAPNFAGYTPESNSGRASPAPTHTIYRETIGPNGHSYHVETIVRNAAGGPSAASAQPHHGALSPTDVHNILRGADSNQTPMSMANALHQSGLRRSASSASLHSRPLTQPGITSSVFVNGGSRASSGRATPDLGLRSVSGTFNAASTSAPSLVPSQSRQGVEVYILSSPEGPRALVFNGAVAEAYYTPRLVMQPAHHQLRNATSFPSLIHTMQAQSRDDANHFTPRIDVRQAGQSQQAPAPQQQQPQQQHQQQQPPQQQQQDHQPRIVPLHAGNPPAVGLPHMLMQLAPHLWLIMRLALFVWFFTSPNSSWSRWLTIIALAFFMFVLSTGLLAGVAEQAWRPLGRHLENVFPAVDAAHLGQGGAAGRDGAPRAEHNGTPDPAQMAARLVAERRDQESWLAAQLRRLERAGLLFLASIAPGVAERHIANLEAEARAQEARRREAEAAAAAAAAAAAESSANHDGEVTHETSGSEIPQHQDAQDDYEDAERDRAIREEISAA